MAGKALRQSNSPGAPSREPKADEKIRMWAVEKALSRSTAQRPSDYEEVFAVATRLTQFVMTGDVDIPQ